MAAVTHFEVYVFEQHGWALQGRYVSHERERAINEAKSLESYLGLPTKVVREYYDTASGMSDEQVVYLSPRIREAQQIRAAGMGGMGGKGVPTGAAASRGHRPNAKMPEGLDQYAGYAFPSGQGSQRYARSVGDLMGRVILVCVASLILAGMGTAIIPAVVNLVQSTGVRVGMSNYRDTLVLVFLSLFLLSCMLLGRRLIPLAGIAGQKGPKERRHGTYQPTAATETDTTHPDDEKKDENDDGEAKEEIDPVSLMDEEKERKGASDDKKAGAPAPDPATQKEADALRKKEQQERERKAAREAQRKAAEEAARKKAEAEAAAAAKAEAEALAAQEPEPPSNPALDKARLATMKFLGGTVAAVKRTTPQLDVFNRFGVNLFLAGACETVCSAFGLDKNDYQILLREQLEVMGSRPAMAMMFVDKLNEYMMEPRYMRMVQAGREAMAAEFAAEADPFIGLTRVLTEWNAPQSKSPSASTIAIVFTDMVGSTAINTKVGDLVAREITRVHNTIVRSALTRFDGQEVKHTGDGIMATFRVISQAVEAMTDVQRAVEGHNKRRPDLHLDLRVGINAGEPVIEENDFYGLAVTLAARICAKADGGEILCSSVVRDLSRGKDIAFQDIGEAELKGIQDRQRLYRVAWRDESGDTAARSGETEGEEDGNADLSGALPTQDDLDRRIAETSQAAGLNAVTDSLPPRPAPAAPDAPPDGEDAAAPAENTPEPARPGA